MIKTEFSDSADWSREAKGFFRWQPSRSLISSIRVYQRYAQRKTISAFLLTKISVLQHRFWSIVTGADIPLNARLGGGLLMLHPNGIVIHPDAEIGRNCMIFQQVTIGTRGVSGVPVIGQCVEIGAGAKILGAVHIGDHAVIGANAVVLVDVPAGATAVGIPARVIG